MHQIEKTRIAGSRWSARFLFTLAVAAAGIALGGPVAARGECEPRWLPGEGVPGVNGNVNAVTTWDPDGAGPAGELLVVGGNFTFAGEVIANHIAAWDGSQWQPLGTGMNDRVRALTVYNGALIAGGDFATAGGVWCTRIARWDGSQWQPLGLGVSGLEWPYVLALTVYNGELIAGGGFINAGGETCIYIARWNGSQWQPLGTGMSSSVHALTVYNGELIAGGQFNTAGGVTCNGIAGWNGSQWQPLGTGMGGGRVSALSAFSGELIAGGYFTSAGGVACNRIARWDGSQWKPLGTGLGGFAFALTLFNGELIAGGYIRTAGGVECNHIAGWDGSQWRPLGTGMSGGVYPRLFALTIYNGELIAGGDFLTAGGQASPYLARWACVSCDLNEDGDVTAEDYWLFVDSFGWCEGQLKYNPAADLDDSGCVNLVDYQAWFECYHNTNGRDFIPPPPRPELDVFIGVLLGTETGPTHVAAADRNGDQSVDGRDIRAFADELLGG